MKNARYGRGSGRLCPLSSSPFLPFSPSPFLPFSLSRFLRVSTSPRLRVIFLARRGISLLEVLAAIGVLSVGLFGLAALLPIGRYTIAEATKADRAGNCGRAALRDAAIRRMLDSANWVNTSTSSQTFQSFIIDPLGVTNGMVSTFGGPASNGSVATVVPRFSLAYTNYNASTTPQPYTQAMAQQAFLFPDDLVLPMPEDRSPPQPIGRPQNVSGGNPAALDFTGAYSWFLAVTPWTNNPTRFTVNVVVCYGRSLTATAERAVTVKTFYDTATVNGTSSAPVAVGGGSVLLSRPINDMPGDTPTGINVKENDWVALCNTNGLMRWYRVASVGDTNPSDSTQSLTLQGPDWMNPTNGSDTLVTLSQIVGVYTTTVDLDTDPTWKN